MMMRKTLSVWQYKLLAKYPIRLCYHFSLTIDLRAA